MATTQEIVKASEDLGKLIASHDTVKKLESAAKKLQNDLEAQRAMNDFNRFLMKLAQKEQAGQPIEVHEKQQLEKMQAVVVRNLVLQQFQIAQMDYLDLMRKVDQAIETAAGPVLPNMAEGAQQSAAAGMMR